ncbi:CheW-like domain-containing protein [Candidatus Hydrogenisulfobacillus filiaventi]|uniref:CheW-like domain-containing protein n=1 Tax=Candidatus Hydrogenisulfobacillus filiaventi TaxID=2707344 RepID=A0A6F8ZD84_9FIRM|nr:CheW-like domain-containing protein [Candidatus Hydrogenisulfobacillus filiaventi]
MNAGQPLLLCQIGPYRFGAPVDQVTELLAAPVATPLPRVPAVLRGIVVVRGQPLPLLALHPLVGLDPPERPALAVRWSDVEGHAALVAVDQVERLWTPEGPGLGPEAWLEAVPPALASWGTSGHLVEDHWVLVWPPDLPARILGAAAPAAEAVEAGHTEAVARR